MLGEVLRCEAFHARRLMEPSRSATNFPTVLAEPEISYLPQLGCVALGQNHGRFDHQDLLTIFGGACALLLQHGGDGGLAQHCLAVE